MKEKIFTTIAGVCAFGIYFLLINTLIYYFDYHNRQKSIHFVKKNENSILVSLSSPKSIEKTTDKKETTKNNIEKKVEDKKPVEKQSMPTKTIEKKIEEEKKQEDKKVVEDKKVTKKEIEKKVEVKEDTTKKEIKEKVVKKVEKKVEKTTTKSKTVSSSKPKEDNHKPTNTKDLFSSIDTKYSPSKPKITSNTKESINSLFGGDTPTKATSNKNGVQESKDSGIENAYLAKIEEILNGWPAQSDYVGERAKVWIRVEPNGSFVFRVTTASGNSDFNTGLVDYLREIQKRGFGSHKAQRAYDLEVEFIASD